MMYVRAAGVVGGLVAGLLCLVNAASGQAPAPYTRVIEEREGSVLKLEMAVREFAPAEGAGPHVFLAGAIHIGEKGFYDGLQHFLDAQDVVLFEGVKPPGAGAAEQDVDGGTDEERATSTKRRVRFIAMAVERFREKHDGKLPATLDELSTGSEERIAWLLKSSLADSWGHELLYTTKEGEGAGFDVVSLGADGKEGGDGAAADVRFSEQKVLSKSEKGDRSEGLQSKLASSMGLVFQLDAMDHNRPNWRNSDMSVDQVQARMEKAGANADALFSMLDGSSMFSRFGSFLLGWMGSTPDGKATLRVMIIEMLGHADAMMERMPGGMGKLMSVIVEDRNRVVLADLKKLLDQKTGLKTIAIIYGAGHLPGMERALVSEMGYMPVGDTWREAISVDAKEAGISAGQIKAMRQMVGSSMQSAIKREQRKPSSKPAEEAPAGK